MHKVAYKLQTIKQIHEKPIEAQKHSFQAELEKIQEK